ncbi:sodium- and chloride-dependent betaine transporter-like isoform X1 [Haliotis rubra]|uniref:sodium- and chloride-dependent betaine transporter-like isoform X1 n=1 Tax=Haliotis rubra TaxID=36100 RepID=UPI001EE55F10|nr:sodium- and chloride-dependent betaine transporter-like isoform X1 [Haliotis rubra]XP_046578283.1 sodium- and chloride-dependent betaine transporter-like isoform X1 [Haliotis rubra]
MMSDSDLTDNGPKDTSPSTIAIGLVEMNKDTSGGDARHKREHWSSQWDYIMSMTGYCVGFGNLWRFPYLCNRNGGGAFLIPFLIFIVIAALPVFYLEASMAQFSGKGAVQTWNFCPLLKGIGIGTVIQVAICQPYYQILLAWPIYYMVKSCSSVLPWTTCGNWWNTDLCVEDISTLKGHSMNSTHVLNYTDAAGINGTGTSIAELWRNKTLSHTAVEEFYQYNVLNISSGIHEIGSMQWHIVGCLFASYVLIFLSLFRGIKASGKVVYVTALLPYILLVAIFIRTCMLPGAVDGILYYLKPDFSKLLTGQVWSEACIQVFYSLGPGWGIIMTASSYNKFREPTLRDAVILCTVSEGTSIFAGFVTFAILGVMAERIGVPIFEVVSSGPGLGFVAYPEALSHLPLPQLWSFLFFLMLLTVGLDSQFMFVELLSTTVIDQFPTTLRHRRGWVTGVICVIAFAAGIIICTQGGPYIMQLLDWYLAALSLYLFCTLECVAAVWLYGNTMYICMCAVMLSIKQLNEDIDMMSGRPLPVLVKVLWGIITPAILVIVFITTISQYESPTYGKYTYPVEATVVGWMVALLPVVPVIIVMIKALIKQHGSLQQRLMLSLRPNSQWRPAEDSLTTRHKESLLRNRRTFSENLRYIFKTPTQSKR